MPERSSTDQPVRTKPSALETFTDRVSEQELVHRLMVPFQNGQTVDSKDFLTVFYGVGGVGKTTLCRRVVESAKQKHPEVAVVVLDLDSGKWTPQSSFAQLLAVLVPELTSVKVPTPLTQALLLMYSQSQVDSGVNVEQGGAGLWDGAVAVLDEGAGAIGIPGIGLLIEGAQWLRDHQRQKETRRRLQELGLWPREEGERIDSGDLQRKLVDAFFEDVRTWAEEDGNLRILFDGFERIQSRERNQDCQQFVQKLAGRFAAASDPVLKARVRILIFGRERVRWDELYDDREWPDYWTQHLLAGLAEADARDFLDSHVDWLRDHGEEAAANAIGTHADAIMDAADEKAGGERQIYPYYLDLAVDMVRQAAAEGRDPDLGGAPGELQDRFLRYLPENERRLMMILALAETFDAEMFDALVRDQRVAGSAVGTFLTSVVEGRSFVMEVPIGGYRFHRLMEDALQELSLKSDAERQQAREMVRWLLGHLEGRIGGRERKDWDESCLECWRRGVEIIVTQGAEKEMLESDAWLGLLEKHTWKFEFPTSLELRVGFMERILECLEKSLGPVHPSTLSTVHWLAQFIWKNGDYEKAEKLFRRALEGREEVHGPEHPNTLTSVSDLGGCLRAKGDYEAAEPLYRRALEGREKALGSEHPATLASVNNLGGLLRDKDLRWFLSDEGDSEGVERLHRRALEGFEKALGPEHPNTLASVSSLGDLLKRKGDYREAELLYRRALKARENAL